MSTDRIEKTILLKAPRQRVWRALSDSSQFGDWFGVKFNEPFTPGAKLHGRIVGTSVNEEVAKMQRKYDTRPFEMSVETIEPERLISFRWHPAAHDAEADYSSEPTTLIEFTLEEVTEGTRLTVTESGFDSIPLARRAQAFASNDQGWGLVVTLIEGYLAGAS